MRCRLAPVATAIAASMAWAITSIDAAAQDRQHDQAIVVWATRLQAAETAAPRAQRLETQRFGEHVAERWPPPRMNRAIAAAYPRRFDREDESLDFRIRHVSQRLAALEHETGPATADDSEAFSVGDLTFSSFRWMGFLSIGLALYGLVVVVRNRPTFGSLRGKNESRDARRTVVRCVVVLIVLNLADLGFTSLLVPTRAFVELNPLADSLLDSLPTLILVKSALIAGGTLLLLALWRHKIAQLASWGTAVTYVFAALWWAMYFHAATS